MSATPRRLVFGEVAADYERHRPSYPPRLVSDLLERAGVGAGDRVLEVGAGTGKATSLFAGRGLAVVAVEPSAEMAAIARRADLAGVELVVTDFERFDAGGERFPLLYSAQAWHWVDRDTRYRHARAVLRDGGLLAVFWNRPAWERDHELRRALREVYARETPQMPADSPLHPDNPAPEGVDDWPAEIAAVPEFAEPEELVYRWDQEYSAADYVGLLGTLSEHRLLDEKTRARLFAAVRGAIDAHGGALALPMVTRAYLARAA